MNEADQLQIVGGFYQLHIDGGKKQAQRVRRASVPTGSFYATHAAPSCRAGHREKWSAQSRIRTRLSTRGFLQVYL